MISDRLFVALVSAVVPFRQDQDRSVLHADDPEEPAIGGNHPCDRRAGPGTVDEHRGRRRRDGRPARFPALRGLQRGTGFPGGTAVPDREIRRRGRAACAGHNQGVGTKPARRRASTANRVSGRRAASKIVADQKLVYRRIPVYRAGTERWPSGRRRSPAKGVDVKRVSWVRIPSSPPSCFTLRASQDLPLDSQ